MKTLSRKLELYKEAQAFGRDAAFVANVILCGHSRPTRKLAGLVELLREGYEISCAPFHIDFLWINGGGRYTFADLEKGIGAVEAVEDVCLCGAPTRDGRCSVRGCVCTRA
jgi:hypothetical protein